MSEFSHSVNVLNRLLSFNRNSAELYSQLLPEKSHDIKVWELIRIRNDHKQSYGQLLRLIQSLGGRAYEKNIVHPEHVAAPFDVKLMDHKPSFDQMLTSERVEIEECNRALGDPNVEESVKTALRNNYLPSLKRHVDVLESFMAKH